MFTVQYRWYAYDAGHQHWTDDYESFETMAQAQQFIADIDRCILNGDSDVRPGRIVSNQQDSPRWDFTSTAQLSF